MKTVNTISLFLVIIFTGSCKKLIEVDLPNDKIITKAVYMNDEIANSALTSIYARMNNENSVPYNLSMYTGFYSDELKNYSSTTTLVAMYTNALAPPNPPSPNLWTIGYNHIYNANAVFEGCQESATLSPAVKQQLMAEAKFIRAFWYFYLTNLYGDVPLILSTDYTISSLAPSATQENIYKQIIDDLQYAETNLNENYVAGNSITVSTERVRPNKATAKALLSRAYLYIKDYTKAELKSTEVIDNTFYQIVPINNVFLITSKEVIWQIAIPTSSVTTGSTPEGTGYILTTKPSAASSKCSTVSVTLYNAFELGDQRKINWIKEFKDVSVTPNVSYYFPFKYKRNDATAAPTEYTTPFRLAEQYLIRAEARAQLNKLSLAISDTDVIRKRAGLSLINDINPGTNKEDLLQIIQHERQVELFTEWGHRFFDIKRTESIDNIMATVSPTKGGTWSNFRKVWPIPLYDIQNNPNLKQNQGYN